MTIDEMRVLKAKKDAEAKLKEEKAQRLQDLAEEQEYIRMLEKQWLLEDGGYIDGTEGEWF